MLRLLISKNLAILPKSFATLTNTNTVSCLTNCFVQAPNVLGNLRSFSLTNTRYCESYEEKGEGESEARIDTSDINNGQKVHRLYKKLVGTSRDRTKTIPYEKSIEYLKSGAYKATYGDHKVWELYRRVHKGQLPKLLTRKTCIRSKVVITGSPCPICRDEYLILHHNNLELLKQFISPYTGEILTFDRTGLCQRQHTKLEVCIERAYDLGLLEFDVPFREFDYSEYYDVYTKPTTLTKRGN